MEVSVGCDEGVGLDTSHWPVVIFKQPAGMTTEQLREALRWWDAHVADQPGPYGLVIDARASERLAAVHRKMIIDRVQQGAPHQRRCKAAAFVFRSGFLRTMLNAILWVVNPPYPVRSFSDANEAVRWASERARDQAA